MDELLQTPAQETAEWERRAEKEPRLRTFVTTQTESAERGKWNAWLFNGLVGGLFVGALVANIVRACQEARLAGDVDRYHRIVGYCTLVVIAIVGLG